MSSLSSRYEVIASYAPLGWLHPTHATIRDRDTGDTYDWNSRSHRKMRHPLHTDPAKRRAQHRRFPRLWCYEPRIVTWHLTVANMLANIFWTLSGGFATWPSNDAETSAKVVYAAGIVAGVFMIVACYLTYVEAINHSHADIVLPKLGRMRRSAKRSFLHPGRVYGYNKSPLHHENHGIDWEKIRKKFEREGYPFVESFTTGEIITSEAYQARILSSKAVKDSSREDSDEEAPAEQPKDDIKAEETHSLIGQKVNIRDNRFVCTTAVLEVHEVTASDDPDQKRSYEWWTWHAALHHLGVLTSLIGFISAIVYLIPMCMGYPLSQNGRASMGVTLFFVDILQILPYICFTAICQMLIAEAAGSWWRPKFDSIGYWTAVFNYLGAWGFLMCGALAIPGTVGSTCCPNIAKWGSAFACFWGSAFYFLGGCLMWIEFANPEPVSFSKKGTTGHDDTTAAAKQ